MRTFPLLLLIAWASAAAPSLRADFIPPPIAPFVAPVPANADWTITVKYPPAPADAPKKEKADMRIAEVHTTKTGETRHDRIAYADGSESDQWFVSGFLVTTPPGNDVAVYDLSNDLAPDPLDGSPSVAKGFPGVAWVKAERYDQALSYEKRSCHHYTFGDTSEAWIDAETRLPAAYRVGDALYRYKFNEPPTSPLILPPAYREAMERAQKMIEHRKQLQRDLLGK